MSRADRRRLKRTAAKALKHAMATSTRRLGVPPPDSVQLVGGPMDGWTVKPDAPALRPDWCTTWPDTIAAKNRPGMYVEVPGSVSVRPRRAEWQPL